MGPPSRSFAADAHDCIMVWIRMGPPNTRVWRDVPPLMASSPRIITQKPWSRRGTVGKNSQQGELIIDDSKNHTRPAERTNGSTSNHLTPKAPYKPAPGMNREIGAKIERVVDLAPGPVPIGAIGTPHAAIHQSNSRNSARFGFDAALAQFESGSLQQRVCKPISPLFGSRCCYCRLSRTAGPRGS